jgi:hypothetical protein
MAPGKFTLAAYTFTLDVCQPSEYGYYSSDARTLQHLATPRVMRVDSPTGLFMAIVSTNIHSQRVSQLHSPECHAGFVSARMGSSSTQLLRRNSPRADVIS